MSNNTPTKTYHKIDIRKAINLIYAHGMTEAEVARHFKVSRQAVSAALKPVKALIKDKGTLEAYRNNKPQILDSIEMTLLTDLVSEKKRKKATLGNIAYAYDKIATHNRLERGLSTANISSFSYILSQAHASIDAKDIAYKGDIEDETANEATNEAETVITVEDEGKEDIVEEGRKGDG